MTSSFPVFANVEEISKNFSGFLLDAYGVFWGSSDIGVLPGSHMAMEKLVKRGQTVGILSNTTALAAKEITKLASHGLKLGEHFHFLLTSGEIARSLFLDGPLPFPIKQKKFWVFGGDHPQFGSPHNHVFAKTSYTETNALEEADFIYIAIPHKQGKDQTDANTFREEVLRLKHTNIPMVCTNPDHFAHEGRPPIPVVRQGSIAALYKEMGGQVYYIGKPESGAYSSAMKYFQKVNIIDPKQVLMVGDTPQTDIRGARNFGMSSALITETGIMSHKIAEFGLETAMQDISPGDHPNFFIKRL